MLSNLTFSLVAVHLKAATVFRCLPYDWDRTSRRLVVNDGVFRIILNYVCQTWIFIVQTLYNCNLILSLLSAVSTSIWDTNRVALDFMLAFGYNVCFPFYINVWLKGKDMAALFNSCLDWIQKMSGKRRKYDGCELFASVHPLSLMFFPPLAASMFVLDPTNPRYLYHRLPQAWRSSLAMVLWTLVIELPLPAILIIMYGAHHNMIIIPTKFINFQLDKIQDEAQHSGESSAWLVRLGIFDSIRILNLMSNSCFAKIIWPSIFTTSTVMGAIGIFGTVLLFDRLPLQTYLLYPGLVFSCPITQVILFPLVGSLSVKSSNFLVSCQHTAPNKAGRLRLQALRPIAATVGSVFSVKKTTVATSLMMTVNLAVNALLLRS